MVAVSVDTPVWPDETTGDATGRPDHRRMVASLPQGIFLLDPGLLVASVNPGGEQFAGQGVSRLIGRSIHDLVTFDEPLIARRLDESGTQLVARGTIVHILDQPARAIDLTIAPVLHCPGWQMMIVQEPVGVEALALGIADDTSGNSAIVRAPDVLAHEIKNPLAGIRGAAQLLDRRAGPGDHALTELIIREVDRIAKLIDHMQSLGRRSAEPETDCNLHEASRHAHAILMAGGTARTSGIERTTRIVATEEFDPSLPAIRANPDALVQVLLNLLSNARDACETVDNPRIIIRTRFASGIQVHSGPGAKPLRLPIELRISDNGPGVAPGMRDHIFEPFVSSKKNGQGLGLALVQKLVHDMHGRVTHDRDEAAGLTHFRLHLPVAGSAPARGAMR